MRGCLDLHNMKGRKEVFSSDFVILLYFPSPLADRKVLSTSSIGEATND